MEFLSFSTPFGEMALGQEGDAIVRLWLPNQPTPRLMPRETPLLARARRQLLEYFDGTRREFDLPLAPQGTPFQQRVWSALNQLPYGQTRTYRDIALAVGCPGGARAVGQANKVNPLPILIPCHRVIATDGSPGGYNGGAQLKRALLALEELAV